MLMSTTGISLVKHHTFIDFIHEHTLSVAHIQVSYLSVLSSFSPDHKFILNHSHWMLNRAVKLNKAANCSPVPEGTVPGCIYDTVCVRAEYTDT